MCFDSVMLLIIGIDSYNKTELDALISQIYFWNEILQVLDSSSVHHEEFFTVHKAVVYVIQTNCQKRIEFRSKNKFEKLVHLVELYYKNLSRCMVT